MMSLYLGQPISAKCGQTNIKIFTSSIIIMMHEKRKYKALRTRNAITLSMLYMSFPRILRYHGCGTIHN